MTTTSDEITASPAKMRKTRVSIRLEPARERHGGHQDEIEDGERQQHLPAEPHELVVAEAREGPPHPDEDGHADADLGDQDGEAHDGAQPAVEVDSRQAPAAEE